MLREGLDHMFPCSEYANNLICMVVVDVTDISDISDVVDVTNITDVTAITDISDGYVTDITRGTVRHMA